MPGQTTLAIVDRPYIVKHSNPTEDEHHGMIHAVFDCSGYGDNADTREQYGNQL